MGFDGKKKKDVFGSKTSFSIPQAECPDTGGLVPAVTEGRPGAAWPVDHGCLGCGGSELLSPRKYRAGARRDPQHQSDAGSCGLSCLAPQGLKDPYGIEHPQNFAAF